MEATKTDETETAQPSKADQCLRLFLSVDVSGSTNYKNRHNDSQNYETHWPRFYKSFFDDFPTLFANKVGNQFQAGTRQCPGVWKCLGDEIIYEDKVNSAEECHKLVTAFYAAILEYDELLRTGEKYKTTGLRVKGTCWTAGFPIRNTKLDVPGQDNQTSADHVGPDLDIGFRLSKATRPGRVVISMDLADILARHNTFQPPLTFYHVGWEVLKGVFGDKPYPIIWIVSDGGSAHIPPWEGYLCPFTEKFQNGGQIGAGELLSLVSSIREELPQLRLFAPYFAAVDMPDHHKSVWADWEKRYKRDQNQDVDMEKGQEPDKTPTQAT